MTRSCFCLLATALLLLSAPAAAEIYKWVDEDGVTHYSQQPPPAGKRTIIRTRTAPAPDDGPMADEADPDSQQDEEAGEEKETIADFCKGLRADLEVLESDRPVRVKAEDGTLSPMGEEERARRLQQTRSQLEQNCQGEDGDTG